MPDVNLSVAISYYEHVSDLLRGRVRPEAISLTAMELPVEEIFFRMIKFHEFDVSEFSSAKYVSLVADGNPPFRAIPVFPSRVFRQSAFYISTRSGIKSAQDLAGKRVGIPEWAQTAGVYARGYLQHQCGVRLQDIHWFQAGVNQAGRVEKAHLSLPKGISIQGVPDRSLNDMLLAGDLDAVIAAREPDAFLAGDDRVARLWPDSRALEEAYFQETHVFPIMHMVVIRAKTLDEHPWIAMNLFRAFEQAKNNSIERLLSCTISRIPFPFFYADAVAAQKLIGKDFWPYGIEPNRPTIDAFLQYCHEQGVTSRRLQTEELFPSELRAMYKV